jgi:hypothetical protein
MRDRPLCRSTSETHFSQIIRIHSRRNFERLFNRDCFFRRCLDARYVGIRSPCRNVYGATLMVPLGKASPSMDCSQRSDPSRLPANLKPHDSLHRRDFRLPCVSRRNAQRRWRYYDFPPQRDDVAAFRHWSRLVHAAETPQCRQKVLDHLHFLSCHDEIFRNRARTSMTDRRFRLQREISTGCLPLLHHSPICL